jgi:hypothetical protein
MKIAFCYTAYNGMELLDKSIEQIHDIVDDVIICYQTVSNKGQPNNQIEKDLIRLKNKYLLHLVEFTPNLNLNTKINELNKHNLMLETAKKLKATHFIVSATDHYYIKEELKQAIIKSMDYDLTLTKMYTYYKHSTWQINPIEDYYMPLVMKIYDNTIFQKYGIQYPVLVDPSVKVNTCKWYYVFNESEIMMHHYSFVRNDIINKLVNAASLSMHKVLSEGYIDEYENYDINKNPGVKYFQGRKIKIVPDYFDIGI